MTNTVIQIDVQNSKTNQRFNIMKTTSITAKASHTRKNSTVLLSSLFLALSGSMLSSAAFAAPSGLNVGLDLGRVEAKKFCNNITKCDNADNTAKAHVGFQFNPNLGVEVGYVSFGTIFKNNDSAAAATQKASAYTASAVGTINFTDMVGIYGRAGAARYDTKNSGTVSGVPVKDEDGVSPFFGAGVKVNLTDNFAIRGEYQLYSDISKLDGKKDDLQALFAGVVFSF